MPQAEPLEFLCPTCASRSYSTSNYILAVAFDVGKRRPICVCNGCSVLFADPQKFTHYNPGEPMPDGASTKDKFDRGQERGREHGPDEIDDDVLDDQFDRLFDLERASDFAAIDKELLTTEVANVPVPFLLGYLAYTARPSLRDRLPSRARFSLRVRERLDVERGEKTADFLLDGIE